MSIEPKEPTLADIQAQLTALSTALLVNKDMLTIDETAIYTGIAKKQLYKMTSTRQVPYYKPTGKRVYFKRTELDKWLSQNRISSTDELETKASNHLLKK